jgi:hypothetical protein
MKESLIKLTFIEKRRRTLYSFKLKKACILGIKQNYIKLIFRKHV